MRLISIGDVELYEEGLSDPGPFVHIYAKCSRCHMTMFWRTFDARKFDAVSASLLAVKDANTAKDHVCADLG